MAEISVLAKGVLEKAQKKASLYQFDKFVSEGWGIVQV